MILFITWFTLMLTMADGSEKAIDLISEYWSEERCLSDIPSAVKIATILETEDGFEIVDGRACEAVQR